MSFPPEVVGAFVGGVIASGMAAAGVVYRSMKASIRSKETSELVNHELNPANGSVLHRKLAEIIKRLDHLGDKVDIVNGCMNLMTCADDKRAMWRSDAAGNCVWASDALCHMFGTTPDRMVANGWIEHLDGPDEQKRALNHWHWCVKAKVPYTDTLKVKAHGRTFRVRSKGDAILSSITGEVLHFLGTAEEIFDHSATVERHGVQMDQATADLIDMRTKNG